MKQRHFIFLFLKFLSVDIHYFTTFINKVVKLANKYLISYKNCSK